MTSSKYYRPGHFIPDIESHLLQEYDEAIETALKVAWSFHGTPYLWGGDDPMAGFDCSGFVIEILKSVGLLPHLGDWTADMLYNEFGSTLSSHEETEHSPTTGMLAFWKSKKTGRMYHVELCLDKFVSIGASGGGSTTVDGGAAIDQNAYIKVRPHIGRGATFFLNPFLRIIQ